MLRVSPPEEDSLPSASSVDTPLSEDAVPQLDRRSETGSVSSWKAMRISAQSLLTTPQWWRQQVWVLSTEIILSLLAAIGLLRDVAPAKVALGLAVAYAVSGLVALPLARGGKGRLAWVGLITIGFAVAAGTQDGKAGWWWLAFATGGLMAFRDSASITASAWSPWRAMRRKTSTLSMAATAQALGITLAALATLFSAIMQNVWSSWAAVVVLVALCLGIPDAFMQRMRQKSMRNPLTAFSQSWRLPNLRKTGARPLITTAIVFSSAHLMGRRLLLPFLLVSLATRAGLQSQALVLVGVSMGFVSVFALFWRLAGTGPASSDPRVWFRRGLTINIMAWLAILLLAWCAPYVSLWICLPWLVIAWLAMEISGRRWSVGYLDSLRALSHVVSFRRNRLHREILIADVMSRNSVAAGGMVLGALAAPALPAVMAALLMVCAWRLRYCDRAQ